MTASKTRAGSRKGAGSSSSNGAAPTVPFKFRGVSLVAPKKIPGSFAYDFGEVQMLAQAQDQGLLGATHRLLTGILGPDELRKVRAVVKGLDDPWQIELLNKVVELNGVDWGEA